MADLRTKAMATLTPAAQARMDNAEANFAADQALQASTSSELARGWTSSGLSEQANKLLWNAASAYQAGDAAAGQQLEAEGRRTAELAQTWAPTVGRFSDINDLSSGAKWAMGALGNVRSSIKPAVASLAGGLVGGLATRSLKGAQLGAMGASTLAGYDQMADETAGTAMLDPTIRATKGYDEILNTARASGALQAPLEGLVPGAMGAMAMGAGKSLAKAGVKGALVKAVGGGAAGEFGTEFAQDLVGQGAQNSLQGKGVTDDLDYQQALDAGAAGAVAGGGMGLVGGAASIGHNATDTAVDVAKDPRQLIDMGAAAAGKAAGQIKNKIDDQFVKLEDYVSGLNIDPDRRRVTGAPGSFADEKDLEGVDIHAMRKPYADRLAAKILDPQSTASEEEREAATNYAQHGDPFVFGDELTIADGEGKQKAQAQSIVEELNGTTKKSKMRSKSFGDIDFEVPASSIKDSGSPPVTGKLRDDVNPEFTDRAPSDPDVFAAKRESARRQGQEFVKDIPVLADIWLKQGIDERIVKEVSQNVAPAQREAAIAIMSWVARGFKGADGEVLIPESLIKSYGKDAPKLISNAYKLAVDQGMVDADETSRVAKDVALRVEDMAKQYESDAALVESKMTPVAHVKFNETLDSNTRGGRLAKMAPIVKALRTIANGGEISKAQDEALDSWFGPRKNEVLDHFYEEKTQPKLGVDEGQDDEERISGLAEDNAFAQRDEHGLSQSTEHGFTKVKEESYYQRRDPHRASGEAGEYFDLTNEEHRVALEELKAGRVRDAKEEGEEPSLRSMSTVGYVDREIEKRQHQKAIEQAGKRKAVREYARSLGKGVDERAFNKDELEHAKTLAPAELTPSERRQVLAESKALHPNEIRKIRREIAERELGITPPPRPSMDAGPGQMRAYEAPLHVRMRAYEAEMRDYERTVERALARLNKNRVAVRVTKSEMPNDLGFTKQDVTDLRLKELNLRAARALVTNGVLVFDNGSKSGNYYATTARKIIAKVVSQGGDAGFTGSLEDAGGNVRLYRMLQDGVTSLMQAGGFTRVGYLDRVTPREQQVKPVWITGVYPTEEVEDVTEHMKSYRPDQKVDPVIVSRRGMPSSREQATSAWKKRLRDQNFPDVLPIAADVRVRDAREQQAAHDAAQEKLSKIERAIHHSEGGAINRLMASRIRAFKLHDRELEKLRRIPEAKRTDEHKKKLADHDVAVRALEVFKDDKSNVGVGVLKSALRRLTGSGELHYTPREAGLLVQLGIYTLTERQLWKIRTLKQGISVSVKSPKFKAAQAEVLKFFEKDRAAEQLFEQTEELADWREKATDFINRKLNNSRLASAAADDFHNAGDIEDLRDALYKITGDDEYLKESVASEDTRTGKPDDKDILEHGTLRDDPNKTVGTKGTAIHRDEHGMAKGDDEYTAGMLTGTGDSKRLVKDAVTGVREVKSGRRLDPKDLPEPIEQAKPDAVTISPATVVKWLRASASNTMGNLREQLDNDRMNAALDTLGRISEISKMTPAELITVDPTLDEGKAARVIERATNVLPRARAMVDAEGGVSDGRVTANSASKEVGQGGRGDVRQVGVSGDAQEEKRATDTRTVAGEVQRGEGVAAGADPVAAWINKAVGANPEKLNAVIAKMTEAQLNKALDTLDGEQFLKNPELDASDMGKLSALYETLVSALPENKQSKVKADDAKTAAGRHKAEQAAREHLTRVLGDKINVEFVKAFNDGTSGEWTKGDTVNTIRLALNSDVLGTAYHESMHEFFAILGKHGGETVQAFMKRVASNKRILNKLSQLLDGQPEAQAQLADPEEALAYMYQFWKAGLLEVGVGPETKSWFQKITGFIRKTLGLITEEMKAEQDLLQAEFVLAAFDSGRFSRDDVGRQKLVDKLNAMVETHDKAMENVGGAINTVIDVAGKYVMSAEGIVEHTKNKHMLEELRLWNQKTGSAMGSKPSFFEAVAFKRNQFANRLENLLRDRDETDVELARKALSTGKEPTHPPAKEIYDGIRKMMDELFEYAQRKNVAQLEETKPGQFKWVGIKKLKNYYPQVWDTDALVKDGETFKALLIKHHMKELTSIAEKANQEAKAGQNAGANTASAEAKPGETITPEMVADAILRRVLNSGGHVELEESTSDLGMSPVATAVNHRQLTWLDPEVFDAFKSKDLVRTMTSYISSMVKRAEHTDRFGHGGQQTRDRADKAFLLEMDGDRLVDEAVKALPAEIDAWKAKKAAAAADGVELDEPFPTLRSVGEKIFGAREGAELLKEARAKAVEKLEQAYRAVMAMEGTLGADISDNMRAFNSWMTTYQNFRLLSTTLFSSFADVVGLVVNGGELGDAWDAFVTGIKEVKLGWGNKKSQDNKALRAEMWGTVDAGSTLDALGQTYGSVFLTGTARRMSEALFKWNGMEAWNRAMRITATSVAERVIKQYKTEGFDATDEAAVARFEELFGKGFDPKDIKLDDNGELDLNDVKNQAAVSKWVNGAILRPNAAQRTIWGSDPHYQMLWHMKQFTYTFQNVIMGKAIEQAKLGNYRPALAAMAGYVPVIIAADAIKELLIPGDEPAWMKSGLAGMLKHGVDRAGLLGVGQMGYDAFATDFGVGLTGPAVSQVLHAPFDDGTRTALRALPFGNLAGRLAD